SGSGLAQDEQVCRAITDYLDELRGAIAHGVGAALPELGSAEQTRSEEHTSELQSRFDLVCRLLLEKKNHIYKLSVLILLILVLASYLLTYAFLSQIFFFLWFRLHP